jgi:AraC-like DNA-binding protein
LIRSFKRVTDQTPGSYRKDIAAKAKGSGERVIDET